MYLCFYEALSFGTRIASYNTEAIIGRAVFKQTSEDVISLIKRLETKGIKEWTEARRVCFRLFVSSSFDCLRARIIEGGCNKQFSQLGLCVWMFDVMLHLLIAV